jgi:hypothetical protein
MLKSGITPECAPVGALTNRLIPDFEVVGEDTNNGRQNIN